MEVVARVVVDRDGHEHLVVDALEHRLDRGERGPRGTCPSRRPGGSGGAITDEPLLIGRPPTSTSMSSGATRAAGSQTDDGIAPGPGVIRVGKSGSAKRSCPAG